MEPSMNISDYRPRLIVDLREDQQLKLQQILPHGTKILLFQAIVDGIIALHAKGGFNAIGAIISGHINVVQLAEAGQPYTHKAISET